MSSNAIGPAILWGFSGFTAWVLYKWIYSPISTRHLLPPAWKRYKIDWSGRPNDCGSNFCRECGPNDYPIAVTPQICATIGREVVPYQGVPGCGFAASPWTNQYPCLNPNAKVKQVRMPPPPPWLISN